MNASQVFQFYLCKITFQKAYLVLSGFIDNVINQIDILLVGLKIKSYISNMYQLLNVIKNSIDWFIHIKSHFFDHILMLGKHTRCAFSISVEKILDDDVNGILDGDSVTITQVSDILHVNRCDNFLT